MSNSAFARNVRKGKFNPYFARTKRRRDGLSTDRVGRRRESKYMPHNGNNVAYFTTTSGNIVRVRTVLGAI